MEPKREILTALGENPIIENKKLVIEPYEWFELIGKKYPALQEEYLTLEPAKKGDFKNKTEALASISTRWRCLRVWYHHFKGKFGSFQVSQKIPQGLLS